MSLNVDQDEINKFADLASRWWDKNSEFKPLHDINPLRVEYIKQKCGGSLQGKKILILVVVVEYLPKPWL